MKGLFMNVLIAMAVVLATSLVAYVAGMSVGVTRTAATMLAQGWTPPQPTKQENPWRGNGGAR